MAYKYTKTREKGADGYGATYEVRQDGVLLGTVEGQEGTRLKFRAGRVAGRTACLKWYAKLPDGTHPKNPHRPHDFYEGHDTRAAAAFALASAATPTNG